MDVSPPCDGAAPRLDYRALLHALGAPPTRAPHAPIGSTPARPNEPGIVAILLARDGWRARARASGGRFSAAAGDRQPS